MKTIEETTDRKPRDQRPYALCRGVEYWALAFEGRQAIFKHELRALIHSTYYKLHGRIVSNWKREGSKVTMEVTIPANTTATVYVPAKDAAGVTESGQPAAKAEGVKFLENDAAVYEVGSGCCWFNSVMLNGKGGAPSPSAAPRMFGAPCSRRHNLKEMEL